MFTINHTQREKKRERNNEIHFQISPTLTRRSSNPNAIYKERRKERRRKRPPIKSTSSGSLPHLHFVQHRLPVLRPVGERVSVVVPVEGVERDGEAQRVEDLVLDGGDEGLQLLHLCTDGARAQVGMAGDWSARRAREGQRKVSIAVEMVKA